jgi:hypothetical protein
MRLMSARTLLRWAVSIAPALLIAAFVVGALRTAAPVAAQACTWTGTWTWTDGGNSPITLTQSGNQVTGHDDFRAQWSGTVSGNHLTGQWQYTDSGGKLETGSLDLTMDQSCASFSGTFGAGPDHPSSSVHATRNGGAPALSSGPSATPSAASAPTTDLTGFWKDDTNSSAVYSIRQFGSQFYWGVDDRANGGIFNIYVGTINGSTITGGWIDLPGSSVFFGGSMNIRIDNPNHLVLLRDTEAPCCYGANELFRQSDGTSSSTSSSPSSTTSSSGGGCNQWNVTGAWKTTQGGSVPISFTFQQSSTQVQGSASAPSLNLNGPLSGTLSGNQLSVVVSWSASVQGNYSGTVQQGKIVDGTTNQVGSSSPGTSWSGTGPTSCVNGG